MSSPSRGLVAIVLAVTIAPNAARADWPTNSTVNLPVCTAVNVQNVPSIATDQSGGAYIAWQDGRVTSDVNIYVHHVLASGAVDPAWPANGRLVCGAAGSQTTAQVVPDGTGGVLVGWVDSRSGSADIYAHHVFANSGLDPAWPADGLPVCTASGSQTFLRMVPDAASGALMAWRDLRNDTDLYVARVLAAGSVDPTWPVNGAALAAGIGAQKFAATTPIVPDGQGGLFATWQDTRDGLEPDIYGQHMLANGGVATGWPANGLAVCKAANVQQSPTLSSDGAGGIFVCWEDLRSASSLDIYAQHVRASGSVDPSWPAEGRAACTAAGHQTRPAILRDLAGGAYIGWVDNRAGSLAVLYAQHLLANGTLDPAWPGADLEFNPNFGGHSDLVLLPDGTGGALAVWDDGRNGLDVYAHHLLISGAVDPAWPAGGRAVGNATGGQDASGAALQDGSGGLIVAWSDTRAGGTTPNDIYAQRVQANGTLGGSVVGVPRSDAGTLKLSPSPNPWRGGALSLALDLAVGAGVTLQLVDIAGRVVMTEALVPGAREVRLAPTARPRPGHYFVRLRENDGRVHSSSAVVVLR